MYDRTSLERKYKIFSNKEKYAEIQDSKFFTKFQYLKTNLKDVLHSENLFDLIWPD